MVTRALDVVGEAVNNGKSYRVYVRGSKWYISERSGNVLPISYCSLAITNLPLPVSIYYRR
jgi:hypothetical protein